MKKQAQRKQSSSSEEEEIIDESAEYDLEEEGEEDGEFEEGEESLEEISGEEGSEEVEGEDESEDAHDIDDPEQEVAGEVALPDVVDEDVLDTNIEARRDKMISDLLSKEDLGIIQMRVKETVKVLSNFKELRDPAKSRGEYLEELKSDLCRSYDYNRDLIELFLDLFPPSECLEFIEANDA